jgi:hypothetical protein
VQRHRIATAAVECVGNPKMQRLDQAAVAVKHMRLKPSARVRWPHMVYLLPCCCSPACLLPAKVLLSSHGFLAHPPVQLSGDSTRRQLAVHVCRPCCLTQCCWAHLRGCEM